MVPVEKVFFNDSVMMIKLSEEFIEKHPSVEWEMSFKNLSSESTPSPKKRPIDNVTGEEVCIVILVLGLWIWACALFFMRWWRFSRIETCNDYKPGLHSPSSTLPPEIVLPLTDSSQSADEGINNNNNRLNSALMIPSTTLPGGRRPSIMIITDQLMKNQKNKANVCQNTKNE